MPQCREDASSLRYTHGMLFRVIHSVAVVFFLATLCQPTPAQVGKLYPVDEAHRDPSFFIFRARLLEAAQQRDAEYTISILSPGIRNGFGGNDGVAEFKKYWKPERPDSKLWKTLTRVLALGGSFHSDTSFMAPYTYSKFPDEYDAFEHGVVVGENVRVRKQSAVESPVVATLSFDIVKVKDWKPKQAAGSKQGWVNVLLKDGTSGYVAEEYIRGPVDYRAIFEKKDGRWQLAAFVSGD